MEFPAFKSHYDENLNDATATHYITVLENLRSLGVKFAKSEEIRGKIRGIAARPMSVAFSTESWHAEQDFYYAMAVLECSKLK
jgi:hypothetical protein